ncbi:MAG: hypothetical protein CL589_00775 [Alteromonadaceae bacterium]|nr:hypothetical protein [Alteromonadaceae bacterium]MAX41169.1 hypothetical protein [Alteromonadaceae bacterium]|tara:strand:- start:92 stop:1276 length:1185 start_codon:yes stop_codon:yes gene_type:complete
MSKGSQCNVKIIAIAKDEGAYLAEWIHHHLYFGFSEIEVVLNRTSDSSLQVLKRINKEYPQVKWRFADFVDLIPGSVHKKLQHIAYGTVLSDLVNNPTLITHVMLMDIDEFWVPTDPTLTIGGFVENIGTENAICFNWLNDLPAKEAFATIPSVLVGSTSGVVKSLFPLSRKIRAIRLHKPLLTPNNYISADGKEFKESNNEDEHAATGCYSGAFIYHRFYRSETEYVSSLFRGNPEGSALPYKTNRNGLPDSEISELSYTFAEERYVAYTSSFEAFIQATGVSEPIELSKAFVLERFEKAINSVEQNLPKYHKQILKLFRNVTEPRVANAIKQFHNKLMVDYGNDVDAIRDLAISVETYSLAEARRIMLKARELRPHGPRINAKINEYNQKII